MIWKPAFWKKQRNKQKTPSKVLKVRKTPFAKSIIKTRFRMKTLWNKFWRNLERTEEGFLFLGVACDIYLDCFTIMSLLLPPD